MSSIAIITARGGSKRIPRKNIKPFMGKPMICYAIEAARSSGLFDEVMVSTDDAEIAEVSRNAGAAIPFMRSAATANDHATTRDVLIEVLGEYAKRGKAFDEFACIYPCVPFLTCSLLRDAVGAFRSSGADALIPVVKFSFPIQRAQRLNADGFLEYREPENASKRSQDLEPMYHDCGMFYFYKTNSFFSSISMKVVPYLMPEDRMQDIDTEDDWNMAEIKYRLLHAGGRQCTELG